LLPQEHGTIGRAHASVLQISRNRFPDICWYGKLSVAVTFASHGELPGFPIKILQREGHHFTGSQPKARQQQQDRIVASTEALFRLQLASTLLTCSIGKPSGIDATDQSATQGTQAARSDRMKS
jgi:hypothetical protein